MGECVVFWDPWRQVLVSIWNHSPESQKCWVSLRWAILHVLYWFLWQSSKEMLDHGGGDFSQLCPGEHRAFSRGHSKGWALKINCPRGWLQASIPLLAEFLRS